MRLALGLISGARAIKNSLQRCRLQGLVEPGAAFTGGHRQQVLACFEGLQHFQHAAKQADVVLAQGVMVHVARPQLRVALPGHVGGNMCQRLGPAQANHIRGGLVAGHGAAHIMHGVLNTAGDQGGGIKQGAIPVKGNQVKTARSRHLRTPTGWPGRQMPPVRGVKG